MTANFIKNVALIGAGGQVGKFIATELLKNKQFVVTALTRQGSKNVLPDGIKTAHVDYEKSQTLIDALQGQDALVTTLPAGTSIDVWKTIVDAAATANVSYVLPNSWGYDRSFTKYDEESLIGKQKEAELAYATERGVRWIGVACGFWYEYSLSGGLPFFGIDVVNKKVRFLDDGKHVISTSTWEQTARATAALLALPIEAKSGSLSQFAGSFIRLQSFNLSQRQMLDAVQRVTGTTDDDYEIEYRPTRENWQEGVDKLRKEGNMSGFVQALYSSAFFADNENDYSASSHNELLNLPKEDLDECTAKAVQMQKDNYIGNLFAARATARSHHGSS